MSRRRLLRPKGLFVRLFGVCALVAVVAVVASTWTTVQATTVAERQERQQSLHADAVVYDQLTGWAATHRTWSGAQRLVDRLAARYGHRVLVTDPVGRVLLDTEPRAPRPRLADARAVLDPLDIDTAITAAQRSGPTADVLPVASTAPARFVSVESATVDPRVTRGWSVRQVQRTLVDVRSAANRCAGGTEVLRVETLAPGLLAQTAPAADQDRVAACLRAGLRTALADRTAPRALLFSGEGPRPAAVFWDFSGDNRLRIAGAAGAVLVVIVLLCAVLAGQIVRPLRRMADAARDAGGGDLAVRVPARRRDELGDVARAFNDMADRRQRLEQARSQLMSDVSHELRTPLSNVRGWLEAAQDGIVPTDAALLASLLEETLQLQRLVEDVHQLAMGDAGALRLESEEIRLLPFLSQVAAAFGGAAESAGVRLVVDGDPDDVLHADPVRLRQAVANLVANALRHTSSGGAVRLSATAEAIVVADDGAGIPPEDVEAVFERFRRVDLSRTRATGGSGLGLAIVRQYMEAEGGSASLSSVLGVGTSVVLDFSGRGVRQPSRPQVPAEAAAEATR